MQTWHDYTHHVANQHVDSEEDDGDFDSDDEEDEDDDLWYEADEDENLQFSYSEVHDLPPEGASFEDVALLFCKALLAIPLLPPPAVGTDFNALRYPGAWRMSTDPEQDWTFLFRPSLQRRGGWRRGMVCRVQDSSDGLEISIQWEEFRVDSDWLSSYTKTLWGVMGRKLYKDLKESGIQAAQVADEELEAAAAEAAVWKSALQRRKY